MLLNFLEDILFYYLKLDRIKTINSTSTSKSSIIYSLQIIYSLYQAKEIAKKSIQQRNEFNKVIKLNVYYIYEFLKFLEVFVFTIHGKIQKCHTQRINLKYQVWHKIKSLNYLMDPIQYKIFKIILSLLSKTMKHLLIILQ